MEYTIRNSKYISPKFVSDIKKELSLFIETLEVCSISMMVNHLSYLHYSHQTFGD